jgi:predicted nucleotide-binding protein
VAVDPKLRAALVKKVGVSERHVNRMITERSNSLMVTREQAAIAIAAEYGVPVTKFASDEDLAVIRSAMTGAASPPPAAARATSPPAPPIGTAAPSRRASKKPPARRPAAGRRRVFVVHGRDESHRRAMFAFLRSIGLSPIEWSNAVKASGSGSPYVGQVLDAAFNQAVAVVVLLTPDDLAQLRPELLKSHDPEYERTPTGQARPNVLFEAGMAFGRHPANTILVQIGPHRPFSDIAGRHVLRMDNSPEQRSELANRLGSAGCEVDLSGQDWLSEGDFS